MGAPDICSIRIRPARPIGGRKVGATGRLVALVPAFEVLKIIAPFGFLGSVLGLAVWSFRHPLAEWGD